MRSIAVAGPLDREDWFEQKALHEYRAACADGYWLPRVIEALAGIASVHDLIADFSLSANNAAAAGAIAAPRAKLLAEEALEAHYHRAGAYLDELARAVHFAPAGAREAAARRIDERFGSPCAPRLPHAALALHFGREGADEDARRWRALIDAAAAQPWQRARANVG